MTLAETDSVAGKRAQRQLGKFTCTNLEAVGELHDVHGPGGSARRCERRQHVTREPTGHQLAHVAQKAAADATARKGIKGGPQEGGQGVEQAAGGAEGSERHCCYAGCKVSRRLLGLLANLLYGSCKRAQGSSYAAEAAA